MPQGQPQAGKLLAVQQLPWSLVWCGARGASWPCWAGLRPWPRRATAAVWDRGCPRDGQVVLVPESQPREGTELAQSGQQCPVVFLCHGCSLPYSSLCRSLQRDYNEGPLVMNLTVVSVP